MNELVKIKDGKPVANSKDIADKFGKTHRHTLTAIRKLINDLGDEQGAPDFGLSSYTSAQGKVLPCYELDRDAFSLLAMGFTGKPALKWKLSFIKAFNKMEGMLKGEHSVMRSLNEAMRLMEEDKQVASTFGKGLSEWKKQRKDHMEKVDRLHDDVQMLLNFTKSKPTIDLSKSEINDQIAIAKEKIIDGNSVFFSSHDAKEIIEKAKNKIRTEG